MKRFFAMLLFLSITFLGGCTQTATKISENSDETIQPSVELSFSDDMLSHNNNASDAICYDWLEAQIVKAKLFCPEIAGLFCRIAGLFCHDSRANLSLKPVCFGIAIS